MSPAPTSRCAATSRRRSSCPSSSTTTAAGSSRSFPSTTSYHRRYEQLFGTPHGTDLVALARAHGIDARPFDEAELAGRGGVRALVATTDRDANLALHESVHAAVAAAYDDLPTN